MDLLGLLKWRSNTSLLQQNLRQLMKVEGGEVVKVRKSSMQLIITNALFVSMIRHHQKQVDFNR